MPRIRTIKPEFYRHHELYLAEKNSGFPIRIAFSGLWTCADKEGRFKWKPTELKLDILPYDELDFNDVLTVLIQHGFIVKYRVENKDYGYIPTFKEHQRITGTETKYESKLPPYNCNGNILESHSVSMESHNTSTETTKNTQAQIVDNQMAFQDDSMETTWITGKDGKERREGNRKGRPTPENLPENLPENFQLLEIYSDFKKAKKVFPEISKQDFEKWRKFVDFVYEKNFSEIFRFRCLNPKDFSKLDFPEEKWLEVISAILGTGVKEEHNLFFRIPQFLKYSEKQKSKNNGFIEVPKAVDYNNLSMR